MFKWLSKLFKSIWSFIKEHFWIILILVIVALAIFFPGTLLLIGQWVTGTLLPYLGSLGAAIGGFFAELGIGGAVAAGLGVAALLDPESVIGAAGSGAAKVLEPFLPILKVGLGAWIAFAILSSGSSSSPNDSSNVNGDRDLNG